MKDILVGFKVSEADKKLLERYAEKAGYDSPAKYARAIALGGGKVTPTMKKIMELEVLTEQVLKYAKTAEELMERYSEHLDEFTTFFKGMQKRQEKLLMEIAKVKGVDI